VPNSDKTPLIRFHTLIDGARPPQRADRSAGGILPTRAFRYCEAVTTASALGWYVFAPIAFSLYWDGEQVHWTFDGAEDWYPLKVAQFPGFSDRFDAGAPEDARSFSPPFLGALPEPGVVQVWSGLLARTRPEWSLLARAPANLPRPAGYDLFEGVVEADRWFGPLFINLRLTRTHAPVEIRTDVPLFQVQPLHRPTYADEALNDYEIAPGLSGLRETDWEDYRDTVVAPSQNRGCPLGRDAAIVRRRRRQEATCPVAAGASLA